jgi:hypothetical protein
MDEPQTMEMEEVKLMNACILICTFFWLQESPAGSCAW